MGESPSQTKCVMDKKSQKQSVLVSIRRSKDALYISNDKGNEWKFPKGMSERVAVASMVYGAMMGKKDQMDAYCDHYRVTIEVERLD